MTTITIFPEDIVSLIKQYNGEIITFECNGNSNITISAKISLLNIKMELNLIPSGSLIINFNKGLIAGINFTGLVREKIFNLLKQHNNNIYNFSLINNQIVLKVEGMKFANVSTEDNVIFGVLFD